MPTYRVRLLTPRMEGGVRFVEDAMIGIGTDGLIQEIGPYDGRPVTEDLRPGVCIPGFVDAHVHFPQTRVIGGGTGTLLPWLNNLVFPEEARFHDDEYATTVAHEFCDALIHAGTTTAMVYGSVHASSSEILLQVLEARGLRAIVGPVLMDVDSPSDLCVGPREALDQVASLASKWHGRDHGRLQVGVIPRFALSCSNEMLNGAGELAKKMGLPISTHLSESVGECAAVLERFPVNDYLEVYERAGLVGEKSVFAHCIHLSDDEWDRFAQAGAKVAHCPDSNFFLQSGNMPLDAIRERDIAICVGSDVAAGRTFSIPGILQWAMKNADCLETTLTREEMFRWATWGGARALGMEKVGILENGWEADMALLNIPADHQSDEAILANLIEQGEALQVMRTWVRGQEIKTNPR